MVTTILQEIILIILHAISRNKDFNALIDDKPFFGQPVKHKQEAFKKLIEMSKNYDYTGIY